jgi:hypothetical protein
MKARVHISGRPKEMGVSSAFVLGLITGGTVEPVGENPNLPSDLTTFDDASLKLIVDEGRLQVDRQRERFSHAISRGQTLLTVDLALLGLLATLSHQILHLHKFHFWFFLVTLAGSGYLALYATGVAAAVVTLPGVFSVTDTTQLTGWKPPILQQLAGDYASAVRKGELTADLRLTALQRATLMTVWSAIIAAIAFAFTA